MEGGGFQDVLQAAADIKAAQLRERPGRQEWERSPDWIKYTSWPSSEVVAAREQGLGERLALCKRLKDAGNEHFKAEDPEQALQSYTQALSVFVWFDRGKDRTSEDIPWVNSLLAEADSSERDEANGLVTALFNNAASCLIKLQQPAAALYASTKALHHDPYNVKAMYRQAVAQHQQGTTGGLEEAVRTLQAAQRLEPSNLEVRRLLQRLQKELQDQRKKDAALYGNMFSADTPLFDDPVVPQGGGGADAAEEQEEAQAALGRDRSRDLKPHEVQRTLRNMQRTLSQAQARSAAAAPAGRAVPGAPPSSLTDVLTPLRALPWWAWALILLHMLYRILKVWRVPMPWAPGSPGGDGPPRVVPAWRGEQRGGMLHGEEL